MKRLTMLALLTLLCAPMKVSAQLAVSITLRCDHAAADANPSPPNVHGAWDFVMDVGGTPNFGLLSIGRIGEAYGGALALWQTAPVVVRKLTVAGHRFHMAVASAEGDVTFGGRLSANGNRICGEVVYHDGRRFPAVAQRRPTTYAPRQPARDAAQPGG